MITATEAFQRLREGNRRFVANTANASELTCQIRRAELVDGQEPIAIILGCSDSRVPAEAIFDQGLGDLFVIRVAGNIIAPSLVGSVEFAASRFGTRLVVVMGHTQCGAVTATIEEINRPSELQSPNLRSIVERIRPALKTLIETGASPTSDGFLDLATRANVRASVNHLRHGSKILEHLVLHDDLRVVGAEYSLETGIVDFFEGV